MKIAFVGKGGSGKTTIASLMSRYIVKKKFPVLAMDADINQHLAQAVGMSNQKSALPPLGIEINRVKKYLRGSNKRIPSNVVMIKTTPPGQGSRLIRFNEKNPLFEYFERTIRGVRIMAVGEFTEEDLGTRCYHSKVGAVELILNHLIDNENEYVIVDMTAGADSFASGMFTKFDLTLLVVEPTLKSVSVYEQYKRYASDYGLNIKVVANKIEDESDVDFIKEKAGVDVIAFLKRSSYIRSLEKGHQRPFYGLEPENQKELNNIFLEINRCKKDWKKFYEQAVYFHLKNAKTWANAAVGKDLTKQIDPNFRFESLHA